MFPLKSSPRNPRHDTNNTGHQGVARWGCGGGVQSRRDHRRDKAWFACAQREDSDKWLSGTTSITTFTRITWPAATSLPHVSSLSQLIVGGEGRRIDRSLSVRFASLHVNHTESRREFRLRGRIYRISRWFVHRLFIIARYKLYCHARGQMWQADLTKSVYNIGFRAEKSSIMVRLLILELFFRWILIQLLKNDCWIFFFLFFFVEFWSFFFLKYGAIPYGAQKSLEDRVFRWIWLNGAKVVGCFISELNCSLCFLEKWCHYTVSRLLSF